MTVLQQIRQADTQVPSEPNHLAVGQAVSPASRFIHTF